MFKLPFNWSSRPSLKIDRMCSWEYECEWIVALFTLSSRFRDKRQIPRVRFPLSITAAAIAFAAAATAAVAISVYPIWMQMQITLGED